MHVHVASRPDAVAYKDNVLSATDEEIELARPQLSFVCKEVKDRMTSNSFQAWKALGKSSNPQDLLDGILGRHPGRRGRGHQVSGHCL
jgi:hypothetical protein